MVQAADASDGPTVARDCPRCGAPARAGANFCDRCGLRLATAVLAERRPLTVLVCDMVDSTIRAEGVDPEVARAVITRFERQVTAAMHEFGGHVARIIGDAAMVYFGYPVAQEDDAERAIHAALSAIARVSALRDHEGRGLAARVGIATGVVVIGHLHDDATPHALDVAGEPPTLATRLQSLARPNTIVVAAETRQRSSELFRWRDLGEVPLKNYRQPVRAWEVVGARQVASRYDAQHRRGVAPMLGRDDMLADLLDHWSAACAGSGHVVLLSGEAGVGKSRMAAALLASTTGHTAVRYFCSPLRQGSALHPCVQQLEWASKITREDANRLKLEKLDRALGSVSQEDKALLAELINADPRSNFTLPPLTPQAKRKRTLEALLTQLERLAHEQPTLVVFEDAQWSDKTSLELLELAVERIASLPVLLLVLARPEFKPPWPARAHAARITLAPLSPAVGTQLVRLLAKDAPLAAQTVANIVDRTDGIPLYIEEITRAVVESEQWQPIGAGAARGDGLLPMWLETSLLARLDRLGDTREVAETAAAIGRRFGAELLRHVVRQPERLAEALDALRAAEIVQPVGSSDTEFVFRHALIRDAAYRILVKERRQEIHRRIAVAIESHFPEVVANQPDELAMHCAEAGLACEAAGHWLKAGHAALRRSAMHEALIHLRKGIDVLPAGNTEPWQPALELDLTIALGKAQTATQGYAMPSTGRTFARARELCVHSDKPALVLAVAHGVWTHALMRAELDSARVQADELRAQGLLSGSRMQQMMGNCFSGVTRHPLGKFAEAVSLLETGLERCDPAQQAVHAALTIDDPRVVMLTYKSWSQMCLGRIAEARRSSEQALAEARAMGHAYTLAHALVGASFVALTVVTPELALQRLDELRTLLADNAIDYYDAVESLKRGWCLAAIGQFEASRRHLESGLAAYRATESRLYMSGFLRMAAEAHGWAGRLAVGFELIDEALCVLEATGQRWDEAETHRVRGALLRSAGDLDGARAEFERARDLAQAQGARLWALRAANDLAELAAGRGGGAAEARWLAEVVDAYEHDPGTPDLARALVFLSRQGGGR